MLVFLLLATRLLVALLFAQEPTHGRVATVFVERVCAPSGCAGRVLVVVSRVLESFAYDDDDYQGREVSLLPAVQLLCVGVTIGNGYVVLVLIMLFFSATFLTFRFFVNPRSHSGSDKVVRIKICKSSLPVSIWTTSSIETRLIRTSSSNRNYPNLHRSKRAMKFKPIGSAHVSFEIGAKITKHVRITWGENIKNFNC